LDKTKDKAAVNKKALAKKNASKKNMLKDDAPNKTVTEDNVNEANVSDESVNGRNTALDEDDNALFVPDHEPRESTPGSESILLHELTPTPESGCLSVPRPTTNLGRQFGAAVDKGKGPAQAISGPVTPLLGADKVINKNFFRDVDYTKPSGSTKKREKPLPFTEISDDEESATSSRTQVPIIQLNGNKQIDPVPDVDGSRISDRSQQPVGRQNPNCFQQPGNSPQSHGPVQPVESTSRGGTQSAPIDVDGLPQDRDDMEGPTDPASTPPIRPVPHRFGQYPTDSASTPPGDN
jgi:hypothetical protein